MVNLHQNFTKVILKELLHLTNITYLQVTGRPSCGREIIHRWVAATRNALSPTADRRVRRMSRDVKEARS